MRRILLFALLTMLLSCIFAQESLLEERIVAVVGQDPILLTEVEMGVLVETGGQVPNDSLAYSEMIRNKINQMIDEKLLLEAAIMESIFVSEEFLEQRFQERWMQFESGFANEEMISAALAQEGYTLQGFKRQMRENLREMITKQQFIQQKFGNLEVTPEYVDSFFQQYKDSLPQRPTSVRLSAIVLEKGLNEDIVDSLYGIANSILKEVDKNTDFQSIDDKLAEEYPDIDIFSGELGTFKRGDLHSSLDSAAFAIKIGTISGIVQSPNGLHILKKTDGNPAQATLEHITVAIPEEGSNEDFENYVEEIYTRLIENPDSFEAFVEEYSVDPVSKDQKGDIGYFEFTQLEQKLQESIRESNSGDVLIPIFRDKQADIFKLAEYDESRILSPEKDFDILRELAIQNKTTELLHNYLDDIRDDVFIDIRY